MNLSKKPIKNFNEFTDAEEEELKEKGFIKSEEEREQADQKKAD